MEIEYLKGDATDPKGEGNKIIVHVCNDIGGWGKGFVLAISNKWEEPEASYRKWHESGIGFDLGKIRLVQVKNDLWVCNLIGQRDIRKKNGVPPIRYTAIEKGLAELAIEAQKIDATIHMPRIGCGLAGGEWHQIEAIITKTLSCKRLTTVVYDFE